MKKTFYIIALFLFSIHSFANDINWLGFSNQVFEQAKKEDKIILLNLEANWCHWCHVMEDNTYSNIEIQNYLKEHFIAVKADQDANPELANRYRDYGWPAIIFLNYKGEDVVKRAGYIAPENFLRLLKAIVADPSPEDESIDFSKVSFNDSNNNALFSKLQKNYVDYLDIEKGGFKQAQKYIEQATFEYALFYNNENPLVKKWIKNSIEGAYKLSDPSWGGMYQYSTHYDWNNLHFEKLLSIQARYISIFLLDYQHNNNLKSLKFAIRTMEYVDRFLSNKNGLYSNAQDADLVKGEHADAYFKLSDAERLKKGIPAIDSNTYTNNNAELAIALLHLYNATGTIDYYNKAVQIKKELLKRKNKLGLYEHADKENNSSSLKDQIAVAQLLIEFIKQDFTVSENIKELDNLCKAITTSFGTKNGWLKSYIKYNGLQPRPIIEENIQMGRIFNWYSYFYKNPAYKEKSDVIFQFLSSDLVAKDYFSEASLLFFYQEKNQEPKQYVYLKKGTGNNFENVLSMLPFYSIIYKGELESMSKEKKELLAGFDENVLLMCTSNYCSSPVFSTEEFKNQIIKNNHK